MSSFTPHKKCGQLRVIVFNSFVGCRKRSSLSILPVATTCSVYSTVSLSVQLSVAVTKGKNIYTHNESHIKYCHNVLIRSTGNLKKLISNIDQRIIIDDINDLL